ncbi:hypothetical protein BH10ACI2_BH10ACI2_04430 [soil metagenome]
MKRTSYLEDNLFVRLFAAQKVLQAATFDWQEDTGTQTGSPTKGTTRTTGVTDVNWKNSGVQGDVYSSYPITAGSNSFEKWQFGKFTGTFNMILTGKFAHTATAFGTGLTLKGPAACTGDGDRLLYTTPSTTANSNLSTDMTSAIAIGSGVAVCFGATGPEATGKAASCTTNPCYTNYLATQLQTASNAAPGDTSTAVLTLQYLEN